MIIVHPNSTLSEKCLEVRVLDWNDDQLKRDVSQMIRCLEDSGGVGLAAPQIGIQRRIILVKENSQISPKIMINPRLQKLSKKLESSIEECLSIPGRRFKVFRHKSIWYSYTTLEGIHKFTTASAFEARIIQHEINHLDGILISDIGHEIL